MIHLACPLRQSFPESGNLFLSLEFTFYWLDWKSTSPRNSHVSAFHRTGVTDAENWGYGCTELGLWMHRTGVSDAYPACADVKIRTWVLVIPQQAL